MKSNKQFEYLSTDGTYKQVYSPDNPPPPTVKFEERIFIMSLPDDSNTCAIKRGFLYGTINLPLKGDNGFEVDIGVVGLPAPSSITDSTYVTPTQVTQVFQNIKMSSDGYIPITAGPSKFWLINGERLLPIILEPVDDEIYIHCLCLK